MQRLKRRHFKLLFGKLNPKNVPFCVKKWQKYTSVVCLYSYLVNEYFDLMYSPCDFSSYIN